MYFLASKPVFALVQVEEQVQVQVQVQMQVQMQVQVRVRELYSNLVGD